MSLNLIHMTTEYSNAVLVAIMPHVSDFAAKMNLPIPQPITVNQIAKAYVTPLAHLSVGVWLTNGYWFMFNSYVDKEHGIIGGFSAPTNAFRYLSESSIARYFGTSHMTTNEAITLARATLLKLGFETRLTRADRPPTSVEVIGDWEKPKGYIPYCLVEWSWPSVEEEPHHLHSNHNTITVHINTETETVVGMECVFGVNNPPPTVYFKPSVEAELEVDYQKRTRGKMFTDTNAPPSKP